MRALFPVLAHEKLTGDVLGLQIFHHITCATDTGNVSTVFNACREIILRENIKGSGFM